MIFEIKRFRKIAFLLKEISRFGTKLLIELLSFSLPYFLIFITLRFLTNLEIYQITISSCAIYIVSYLKLPNYKR